jgi:hypothetical protein
MSSMVFAMPGEGMLGSEICNEFIVPIRDRPVEAAHSSIRCGKEILFCPLDFDRQGIEVSR